MFFTLLLLSGLALAGLAPDKMDALKFVLLATCALLTALMGTTVYIVAAPRVLERVRKNSDY